MHLAKGDRFVRASELSVCDNGKKLIKKGTPRHKKPCEMACTLLNA